jgi:hypothetical protein
MKRKVVNPDPQEKKIRQVEEKIYKMEMKEEELGSAELLGQKKEKFNEKSKGKYKEGMK